MSESMIPIEITCKGCNETLVMFIDPGVGFGGLPTNYIMCYTCMQSVNAIINHVETNYAALLAAVGHDLFFVAGKKYELDQSE